MATQQLPEIHINNSEGRRGDYSGAYPYPYPYLHGCRDDKDSIHHHLNGLHSSTQHLGLCNKIGDSSRDIMGKICCKTDSIKDSVERHGLSIKEGICDLKYTTSKDNGDLRRETTKDSGDLRREMTRDNSDVRREISLEGGNTRLNSSKEHTKTRKALSCHNTSVLLEMKDHALELCKMKGELERQASDNAACIKLDACKNKQALSEQMSRQHCKIKRLVEDKANETQELILKIENERLRNELAEERTRRIVQKQCASRPPSSPP